MLDFTRPSIIQRALKYYTSKLERISKDEKLSLSQFTILKDNLEIEIDNVRNISLYLLDPKTNSSNPYGVFLFDPFRHVLCRALKTYHKDLVDASQKVESEVGIKVPLAELQTEIKTLETNMTDICSDDALSRSHDPTAGTYLFVPEP